MQQSSTKLKIVYKIKLTQVNILDNFNNINKAKKNLFIHILGSVPCNGGAESGGSWGGIEGREREERNKKEKERERERRGGGW